MAKTNTNGTILAYELLGNSLYEPKITFPNIDELNPSVPADKWKVILMSYGELDNREVKGALKTYLELVLGYTSLEEMRADIKMYRDALERNSLKYILNPLSKSRERKDIYKTLYHYATPTSLVTIPYLTFHSSLFTPLMMIMISNLLMLFPPYTILRMQNNVTNKFKIVELERKIVDPKTPLFLNLRENADNIKVESVLVPKAKKVVENAENSEIVINALGRTMKDNLELKLWSPIIIDLNEKLTKIYNKQPIHSL